jgi:hypothetical protein
MILGCVDISDMALYCIIQTAFRLISDPDITYSLVYLSRRTEYAILILIANHISITNTVVK